MKKEKAIEQLANFKSDLVVVGIKCNGIRISPAQFELYIVPANKDDIYEKVSEFYSFRVFELKESATEEATWKSQADNYLIGNQEAKERQLLEQLKAKYE